MGNQLSNFRWHLFQPVLFATPNETVRKVARDELSRVFGGAQTPPNRPIVACRETGEVEISSVHLRQSHLGFFYSLKAPLSGAGARNAAPSAPSAPVRRRNSASSMASDTPFVRSASFSRASCRPSGLTSGSAATAGSSVRLSHARKSYRARSAGGSPAAVQGAGFQGRLRCSCP